jgi:primosomal protein N' (replication factor Y)
VQYAVVLVDTPSARETFCYAIPPDILPTIQVGSLVRVPFRNKEVDGLLVKIVKRLPSGLNAKKIRPISRLIHQKSLLPASLLPLAEWLADYYLSSYSEALFAMLPPFPKLKLTESPAKEKYRKAKRGLTFNHIYFLHGREQDRWQRYFSAVENMVTKNNQVLMIFPNRERAVRFLKQIQNNLSIRTSLFTADLPRKKRFLTWRRILYGEYDLIVGTRIAIFAPLTRLGLIIVDDESHHGHKEQRHPRYHVREVALKRSELEGSKLLLGGVLPSLTTFARIKKRQTKVIEAPRPIAPTTIVDTRSSYTLLSPTVEQAVETSPQTIFFTTRLGKGGATRCRDCGYLFRCPHCLLPKTLHGDELLLCHHCGHQQNLPPLCPHCQGANIRPAGIGTERLEDYLVQLFPHRVIGRLEAKSKPPQQWDLLVSSVKLVETDLEASLVVATGLDGLLELPDPYAVERVAQLLTNLRTKASRAFFVESKSPDHPVFRVLRDEQEFLNQELTIRKKTHYPPTVSLIRLLSLNTDPQKAAGKLTELSQEIKKEFSPSKIVVLGPGPCFYGHLRGQYRWHLLLKLLTETGSVRKKIYRLVPQGVIVDPDPTEIL